MPESALPANTAAVRRLLVVAVAVLVCITPSCSDNEPHPGLVVIGIDGLEWNILLPLLEEGKLPHLARLMERGVYGVLETTFPTSSPIIWTTIATGKGPKEHGIEGFFYLNQERQMRLYTSRDRKVKAVWDILSENDRTVDVTGWWATWPADRVNGHMVSQYSSHDEIPTVWKGTVREDLAAQTYPPSYFEEILPIVKDVNAQFKLTELRTGRAFPEKVHEILGGLEKATFTDLERQLVTDSIWAFRGDETYARIAKKGLRHGADLTMVYLGGPDVAGHRFMRYHWPRAYQFPPSAEALAAFGPAIRNCYRYIDRLVGEILSECSEDTAIIVLSDHGMVPVNRDLDFDRVYPSGSREGLAAAISGNHPSKEPGVLIAAGGPFRRPAESRSFTETPLRRSELSTLGNVFEIAPTILYLTGLEVARDMQGGVMKSLIRQDYLDEHPAVFIETYETDPEWFERRQEREFDGLDAERLEQLRGLGYIGSSDRDR